MSSSLATFELSLHPDLALFEEEELSIHNALTNDRPPSLACEKEAHAAFDIFRQEESFDKFNKERKFVVKLQMTAKEGKCEGELTIKSEEDTNDNHFSKWCIKVVDDEVSLKLIEKSEDFDCTVCGCLWATNFALEHENQNSERHIKNQRFDNNQTLLLEKFKFPIDELLVALIITHEVTEQITRHEVLIGQEPLERLDTPMSILGSPFSPNDSESTVSTPQCMQINKLLPPAVSDLKKAGHTARELQDTFAEDRSGIEDNSHNHWMGQSIGTASNTCVVDKSYLDTVEKQHKGLLSTIQNETVNPLNSAVDESQQPLPTYHLVGNELYVTYKVTLPPSGQEQSMLSETGMDSSQDSFQMPKLFPSQSFLQVDSGEMPLNNVDLMNLDETMTPNLDLNSSEAKSMSLSYDMPLLDLPAENSNEQSNGIVNSIDDGSDTFCSYISAFCGNAHTLPNSDISVVDNNDLDREDSLATPILCDLNASSNILDKACVEMRNMGYDGTEFCTIVMIDKSSPVEHGSPEQLDALASENNNLLVSAIDQLRDREALNYCSSTSATLETSQQLKQRPIRAMLNPHSGRRANLKNLADSRLSCNSQHDIELEQPASECSAYVGVMEVLQNEAAVPNILDTQLEQLVTDPTYPAMDDDGEQPPELEPQAALPIETRFMEANESGKETPDFLKINKLPTANPIKIKVRMPKDSHLLKCDRNSTNQTAEGSDASASLRKRRYGMRPTRRKIATELVRRAIRPVSSGRNRKRRIAPKITRRVKNDAAVVGGRRDKDNDTDYVPNGDNDAEEENPDYQVEGRRRRGRRKHVKAVNHVPGEDKEVEEEEPDYQVKGTGRRYQRKRDKPVYLSLIIDHELPKEGSAENASLILKKHIKEKEKNSAPSHLFLDQFERQEFCDYDLLCEGKVLKAHRFVLNRASEKFRNMRPRTFIPKRFAKNQATVNCCTFEVLSAMVRFCYTSSFPPENLAMGMFQAAATYGIPQLKEWAANILIRDLAVANACEIAVLGSDFEDNRLLEGAHKIISSNPSEIILTRGFQLIIQKRPDLLKELFVHLAVESSLASRKSSICGEQPNIVGDILSEASDFLLDTSAVWGWETPAPATMEPDNLMDDFADWV